MAVGLGPLPTLHPVPGFELGIASAGIKRPGRKDVVVMRCAEGSRVAGVTTTNAFCAAPVLITRERMHGPVRYLLTNTGNANAGTGPQGLADARRTCAALGALTGVDETAVLPFSTGVIGEPLPADRITAIVDKLAGELEATGVADAARAIMTTDTFAKGATASFEAEGGRINIVGIAKGSGMIAPDMATMLVYVFTDARIAPDLLQRILSSQLAGTFNAITVDSDTSTSDALILAATGKSPAAEITDLRGAPGRRFAKALGAVMLDLAQQVVKDGEGATKFVEVQVTGAASAADAHRVAMAIANSPLVKTAIAGEDANWGRVVAAVGKSGAAADRDRLSIRFGDMVLAENGWRAPTYDEAVMSAYMKNAEIDITVHVASGRASAMPEGETLANFAATGATLAIHLSVHVLDRVQTELTPHYGPDCPVAVVFRASWPDQQVIRTTLAALDPGIGAGERTALVLVGPALAAEGFDESRLYAGDYDRRFRPVGTDPRFPE